MQNRRCDCEKCKNFTPCESPTGFCNSFESIAQTNAEKNRSMSDVTAYREVGTQKEYERAVEKCKAKKILRPSIEVGYKCPSCNSDRLWKDGNYCRDCGQRLQWE